MKAPHTRRRLTSLSIRLSSIFTLPLSFLFPSVTLQSHHTHSLLSYFYILYLLSPLFLTLSLFSLYPASTISNVTVLSLSLFLSFCLWLSSTFHLGPSSTSLLAFICGCSRATRSPLREATFLLLSVHLVLYLHVLLRPPACTYAVQFLRDPVQTHAASTRASRLSKAPTIALLASFSPPFLCSRGSSLAQRRFFQGVGCYVDWNFDAGRRPQKRKGGIFQFFLFFYFFYFLEIRCSRSRAI